MITDSLPNYDLKDCGPVQPLNITSVGSGRSEVENETGPAVEPGGKLTPGETGELESCEQIVEAGLKTFVEVGIALTTIRDRRLYRAEYCSFAQYLEERWEMKARQAQRLMVAAEIYKNLASAFAATGPALMMPAGERLVRPLASLPPEQQCNAWATAVETAPNGRVTVVHVERVVATLLGHHEAKADPAKPVSVAAKPPIDVRPSGSKEEILTDAAEEAIDKVRELLDLMGAPDSAAGAEVSVALERLQDFKTHLARVQKLQEARG